MKIKEKKKTGVPEVLSPEEKKNIILDYYTTNITQQELSAKYFVSATVIYKTLRNGNGSCDMKEICSKYGIVKHQLGTEVLEYFKILQTIYPEEMTIIHDDHRQDVVMSEYLNRNPDFNFRYLEFFLNSINGHKIELELLLEFLDN